MGLKTFLHYPIEDYPANLEIIVSAEGFGKNDYVTTDRSRCSQAKVESVSRKVAKDRDAKIKELEESHLTRGAEHASLSLKADSLSSECAQLRDENKALRSEVTEQASKHVLLVGKANKVDALTTELHNCLVCALLVGGAA